MSLRINQNVASLDAHKQLSISSSKLTKSIQRLSTGLRINSAADDVAGLAISEKMRRQIRGLSRAVSNAQDGISMVQTAEGAIGESQEILHRIRELAIHSANDTLTSNDRLEIQKEVEQLKNDLDRISTGTEFNTKKLLNGTQSALLSASSNAVKGFVVGDISGSAVYDIEIETLTGGLSQMLRSQIFTINNSEGNLAEGTTQLQSIAQFYDDDGVFVLETPQTLTFYGNGKETNVYLDGQMTLDNLAGAIQNAITRDTGLGIKNSKVATVATAHTKIANVGGYIQVISGAIGDAGSVLFSSDQKVMDALGMTVTRDAIESQVRIKANDGHGNFRQIDTTGNRARGLLDGIDVQFSSQAAQIASTKGLENGLKVGEAGGGNIGFTVSAGGKTLNVNIEQGHWTMEGLVRSLNAQFESAGGIDGLRATLVDGEMRMTYERPISVSTSIPGTIKISAADDEVKTLGFVEGTYNGFVDAQKDQSKVRWGISTFVDQASVGDIVFSVGDGKLSFATNIALVSSRITADMKVFSDFQVEFNSKAQTNSVKVRVDQVGTSMVFSALRVGTERTDTGADIESRVELNFNNDVGSIDIQKALGLVDGTIARGTGHTNFQFSVADRRSQLQIGADKGQTMSFGIAELSAEALGVDRLDLTTISGANKALGIIDKAVDTVTTQRSALGAVQNRLEFTINNMRNTHSNLVASESRIRDADIAMEMIEFTRNQIISQAGTAMLAQANSLPLGILDILGG